MIKTLILAIPGAGGPQRKAKRVSDVNAIGPTLPPSNAAYMPMPAFQQQQQPNMGVGGGPQPTYQPMPEQMSPNLNQFNVNNQMNQGYGGGYNPNYSNPNGNHFYNQK